MSPTPIPDQKQQRHVVVLGAGVTGLTSALFLAEAGYKVTILAAHVPGDSSIEYTSPWAGAHWLPHARVHEPEVCDWDVQTYEYWLELMRREEEEEKEGRQGGVKLSPSGLKQTPSYEFWDTAPEHEIWYAPHVESFRQLSPSRAPISAINQRAPPGTPEIAHGACYKAMCVNVPQYLLYLQARAKRNGVEVVKARLETSRGLEFALKEAEGLVLLGSHPSQSRSTNSSNPKQKGIACFINATGLASLSLCSDPSVFPIRGQTVLVKGEARSTITRTGAGYGCYSIPRPGSGTTILGGTKEAGEWESEPDAKVTEAILRRNAWAVPELLTGEDGGFEVISVQCGLRPGRRGGVRVEGEVVGDGRRVVHAYGHAGAGYQNSVGSARKVVRLVGESVADADEAAGREMQAKL